MSDHDDVRDVNCAVRVRTRIPEGFRRQKCNSRDDFATKHCRTSGPELGPSGGV